MSLHYLNRCNMDKIASHPRNTVTWMPIVEQAAQATQFQNSIPSWVKDSLDNLKFLILRDLLLQNQ